MTTHPPSIRAARDDDGPALAALIASCFSEYPGCLFEITEFPELQAPASHFAAKGGRFWVATDQSGEIVGSIAATPKGNGGVIELTKMYVARAYRGTGLAQMLFGQLEAFASSRKAGEIMLWSDVLFTRAHAFYRRLGFEQQKETRELRDVSNTREYQFRLRRPIAEPGDGR